MILLFHSVRRWIIEHREVLCPVEISGLECFDLFVVVFLLVSSLSNESSSVSEGAGFAVLPQWLCSIKETDLVMGVCLLLTQRLWLLSLDPHYEGGFAWFSTLSQAFL